jgi:hypothetical protein
MPRTASPKVSKKLTKPAKRAKSSSVKSATAKRKDDGLPLSQVIRKRIQAKKARFHANDNIAEFIYPGEIDGLIDEVTEKYPRDCLSGSQDVHQRSVYGALYAGAQPHEVSEHLTFK